MAKRVLVVDDHPPTVKLIQTALRSEGFEVVSAANGAECLLAIQAHQPDLVVLDVIMPVMDGFQVLRVLRENPGTKHLPVIILSIRSSDEDVLRGLSSGAEFYLTKPFRVSDIVSAAKRLLSISDSDDSATPAP